jgi:transketolase
MPKNENSKIIELQLQAERIRKRLVEMIFTAKSGHIGGALSSVEMETALYFHVMNIDPKNPKQEDRDRFILSKGHSVETLYSVLSAKGFIEDGLLDTYGKFNTLLAGHPVKKVAGVELNSGALGHGLSVGVGMCLSAKMDLKSFRTFVLMGDGEQAEGSIYEAAMAANHYHLDNIVAIIDRNTLQISGKTEEVMKLEPIRERWEAFGWEVFDLDGNNMGDIIKTYTKLNYTNGKPKLLISHTTKGCGVSFMEKIAKWHHGVPNENQYQDAIAEINERIKSLEA